MGRCHPPGCRGAAHLRSSQWDNADEANITKKKIKSVLVFPELRQYGIATGGADAQVRGRRRGRRGKGHFSPRAPCPHCARADCRVHGGHGGGSRGDYGVRPGGGGARGASPAVLSCSLPHSVALLVLWSQGLNEQQKYVRELERRLQLPANSSVLERLGGRPGPDWVPAQDLAETQRELEEMKAVSVRHVTTYERLARENNSLREEVERFQSQAKEEKERARAAVSVRRAPACLQPTPPSHAPVLPCLMQQLQEPEMRRRREAAAEGKEAGGDEKGKDVGAPAPGQFALWHLLLIAVLCFVLGKLL